MKKATVYVAYVNSDLNEGRGRDIPFVVCELKETAIRLGKGKNVQGADARVRPVDLIEITNERGVSLWYAPVRECIDIKLPNKSDKIQEGKRKMEEKIVQKAKDAGLSDEEIRILKGK